jgi:nitrogen fixation/metabolism regulation signal transduction histidine kinase
MVAAITPAVLVAIFASITLDVGLRPLVLELRTQVDRQFVDQRWREAYVRGKCELPAGRRRLSMANVLDAQPPALQPGPHRLHRSLMSAARQGDAKCSARGLSYAPMDRPFMQAEYPDAKIRMPAVRRSMTRPKRRPPACRR